MIIHAHLFATFRLVAGVKSIDLDLPQCATLLEAVQQIAGLYPVIRPHWLDANGELHAHVHIFHNGKDFSLLPAGLHTILLPGDTLEFFPPVAGG